jgi:hypothetical protein
VAGDAVGIPDDRHVMRPLLAPVEEQGVGIRDAEAPHRIERQEQQGTETGTDGLPHGPTISV